MNPNLSAPAPLAPTTPPVEDINLDDLWGDSDDWLHVECCAKQAFLCGHPYHPEAAAGSPQDDTCEECIDLVVAGRCPPPRPTHFHCPLIEAESGLLTFCKGPKRTNDQRRC